MSIPERSSEQRGRQYCFGDFTLDLERGFLWRGVEELKLRPKSFEVLTYLIEHQGRLVTKDELASAVWAGASTTDNSLAQCLLEVRRALGDDSQQLIRTVARRGYIFTAPITTPIVAEPIGLAIASAPRETPEEHQETQTRTFSSGIRAATASKLLSIKFLGAFVLLAIIGGGIFWFYRAHELDRTETLAVLPFRSIGSQSLDEYLELGMTDALITKLGNLNRIIVRPTAAVRKYATSQDPVAAGRDLGATAVMEGTVQRLNDRIRVSAQLLRISDGRSLWADNFDENFNDVFSVQDSISGKIANALLRNLTGDETTRVKKRYTVSPEAYELYAKGRYSWEQRTDTGLRRAIFYFEQAIQKDPQFALAYAGLAECYGPLMQLSFMSAIEALPKMEDAASRAVEIDDTLAEAHTALAAARMNEWDWPSTEREFRRAIALNANEEMAHRWYGFYLEAMGRQKESLAERERAYQLDPSNLAANAMLGWALFRAGRSEEAIAFLTKAIELNPDFAIAHENLGKIYVELRSFDKALEQFGGPDQFSERMYVLARSGNRAVARRDLEQFVKLPPSRRPGAEMSIAATFAALGDREEAFSWLETAYRERNPQLMFLKVDERFSNLRSEPRFRDLLRRVRLL